MKTANRNLWEFGILLFWGVVGGVSLYHYCDRRFGDRPAEKPSRREADVRPGWTTVNLELQVPGIELEQDVRYKMTTELLSLSNVQVADTQAEWTIQIIAKPGRDWPDREPDIAVSIVFLRNELDGTEALVAELRGETTKGLKRHPRVQNTQIVNGRLADLPFLCREIAAAFDSKCLQPARQEEQRLVELLNRQRESKRLEAVK